MRILTVDGYTGGNGRLTPVAVATLEKAGHQVDLLHLAEAGFDVPMSAAERSAYHHEGENLVTEAQRESAALLRRADALVICCPLRAGAVDPVTKSWLERVFVPGVAFGFKWGRVSGALTDIRRIAMLIDCPTVSPEPHRREAPAPALLRAVRLTARRSCRTTYCTVMPGEDPTDRIPEALGRW